MKNLLVKSSAFALCLGTLSAQATVITFDDVALNHIANFGPDFGIPAAGYGGLNWTNTIVEPQSSFDPGSLSLNVSPPNVATDVNYLGYTLAAAPIEFSASTPFSFQSAYFISNQQNGLNVTVNGLRDGIVVDTQSFQVGTTTAVLGQFNWSDIDTVVMSGSGGTNPSAHESFSIDNVVVAASPVPLPAAAWLLLSGIGGMGALARKLKCA